MRSEGDFRICLSGGSTPKRLYEILATRHLHDFPWTRTHWFWGDERFVPLDSDKSNYHMTRLAMLDHAPVPPGHIHPILTQSESEDIAAQRYQSRLHMVYGSGELDPKRPLFDITLLGLGEDGHTASLFPGVSALKEDKKWVVGVPDGTPPPRVSLTYPALNSTRHMVFLVAGAKKRDALSRIMRGDESAPAQRVKPVGDLHLFLDKEAAVALNNNG
jgi:6-phosphogluconolactonase